MDAYVDNGGTVVAIAGDNYVVFGTETRLAVGYQILSRNVPKIHKLTNSCYIGAGGCYTDIQHLQKLLDAKIDLYKLNTGKELSTESIGRLVQTTLYNRRMFPFYTFNVVAGIDKAGKGAIYSYDAVGCIERNDYVCEGSAQTLIMPFLDNLVGKNNRQDLQQANIPITKEEAVSIMKEAFLNAGERDIYTGDSAIIYTITKEGATSEVLELKND